MDILFVKKSKVLSFLIVAGIIAFLICVSSGGALASQGEDLFALGNQAYAGGKYDEALSCYKRVIEQEGYSASLLFNMANAYYKKKDVGQAILHYERALYLDPGNADIRANLALARKDFGLISDLGMGLPPLEPGSGPIAILHFTRTAATNRPLQVDSTFIPPHNTLQLVTPDVRAITPELEIRLVEHAGAPAASPSDKE